MPAACPILWPCLKLLTRPAPAEYVADRACRVRARNSHHSPAPCCRSALIKRVNPQNAPHSLIPTGFYLPH